MLEFYRWVFAQNNSILPRFSSTAAWKQSGIYSWFDSEGTYPKGTDRNILREAFVQFPTTKTISCKALGPTAPGARRHRGRGVGGHSPGASPFPLVNMSLTATVVQIVVDVPESSGGKSGFILTKIGN